MQGLVRALTLAAALLPATAQAGPPFLTDDPVPTDIGHWEIYAPLFEAQGRGKDFAGAFGAEINYGPMKDVQLTLGLPTAFTHDATGASWGAGDLEASVKYRFYHDEAAHLQIAAFPGIALPTASHGLGADHVTALLPIWAQKVSANGRSSAAAAMPSIRAPTIATIGLAVSRWPASLAIAC